VTVAGKSGGPSIVRFDTGGSTINVTDGKNRTVRTIKLVGRIGPTACATTLFAVVVSLGLFAIYLGAIHIYGMSRLRTLLVGLPRSNERITFAESFGRFGTKMSNKLLALMGFGAALMLVGNASALTEALLAHRSIDDPIHIFPVVASVLVIGQVVLFAIMKMRARGSAS